MNFDLFMILFLTVVVPLWIIFHYGSRAKDRQSLTPDDEKMLEDLWRSARAMEGRLEALEKVLDLDREDTRRRSGDAARPSSDRLM